MDLSWFPRSLSYWICDLIEKYLTALLASTKVLQASIVLGFLLPHIDRVIFKSPKSLKFEFCGGVERYLDDDIDFFA